MLELNTLGVLANSLARRMQRVGCNSKLRLQEAFSSFLGARAIFSSRSVVISRLLRYATRKVCLQKGEIVRAQVGYD